MNRILLAGLVSVCIFSAQAAVNRSWIAEDGDWSVASNWQNGLKPSSAEMAYLDNGGIARLTTVESVYNFCVGFSASAVTTTVVQTDGQLKVLNAGNSPFAIGGLNKNSSGAAGRYELHGGVVSVASYSQVGVYGYGELIMTGGEFKAEDWTAIGRFVGSKGLMRVEGGVFTQVYNGFNVGEDGDGTLIVTNAGVVHVAGPFSVGRYTSTSNTTHGVVRLEAGGLLAIPSVGGTEPSEFTFAGGTLQVLGAGVWVDPFFVPSVAVFVEEGGARIDTNGNDIRINSALQAPANGASAGGLVKLGGGTLRLAGVNAYTGPTIVSNGVLVAETPASLPGYDEDGRVVVCEGATLLLGDAWTDAERAALNEHAELPDDSGRIVWGAGTLTGAFGDELDATKYLYLMGGAFAGKDGVVTNRLGTGAGEIAFAPGAGAGFSTVDAPVTVALGGDALQQLVWGEGAFGLSALLLNEPNAQAPLTFSNPIDLNGGNVQVAVNGNTATLAGAISDEAGGSTFTKSGAGTLVVKAPEAGNTFGTVMPNSGTTVFEGGENTLAGKLVHNVDKLVLTNTTLRATRIEFANGTDEVVDTTLEADEIATGSTKNTTTAETLTLRGAHVKATLLQLGYVQSQQLTFTAKDSTFEIGQFRDFSHPAVFENCTITGTLDTYQTHWMFGTTARGSTSRSAEITLKGGSMTSGNASCDFQVGAYGCPKSDTLTLTDGAAVSTHGWPAIGRFAGATGTINVVHGTFTQTHEEKYINVGEDGHGTINVGSQGVVTTRGLLLGATANVANINSWGEVNVEPGGVLNVGWINGGANMAANHKALNVNGGTIRAAYDTIAKHPTFIDNLTAFNVGAQGVTFDSNGRTIEVASPIVTADNARLPVTNIVHRWSFNGNLEDSVGGATATGLGGISFANGNVCLPGGKKAGAVDLGANMLPTNSAGVTIEVWATQRGKQAWSRILDSCKDGNDALLMAWTAATDINDDDVCIKKSGNGDMRAKLAPYTLNTEFHIAMTLKKRADGFWDGVVYKQNAVTGATLRKHAFTTTTAWSPATQGQIHCYVGRSFNPEADADAQADYNEFRIWNTALTEAQLTASAQQGPDASLAGTPLRKTGSGTLALTAAGNDWTGATIVESGTLVAGMPTLMHRWSFNGDYSDSAGGLPATPTGNVTLGDNAVQLPGGNWGAGYVDLGANIFPKAGDGVTLELWARQDATYSWSRIFEFGSRLDDSILMAWTAGTNINTDDVCFKKSNGGKDWRENLYPYTLGKMWHIALTFARRAADGLWDVTVYKQDPENPNNGRMFSFTTTAGWSPLTQSMAHACLGHSLNSNDKDAAATYDEVRVWNVALTEEQLKANAALGPDELPVLTQIGQGSTLPSGTALTVASGATLDLAGNVVTGSTVNVAGTVLNGTLVVEDAIYPGGEGTVGTLVLDGRTTLQGRLVVDAHEDGTCDKIDCTSGSLNLSGLRLELSADSALSAGRIYEIATFASEATGAEAFTANAQLPRGWTAKVNPTQKKVILSTGGMVIFIR